MWSSSVSHLKALLKKLLSDTVRPDCEDIGYKDILIEIHDLWAQIGRCAYRRCHYIRTLDSVNFNLCI